MTLEQLSEAIPPYAKDLKLNLTSVFNQPELTPQQSWGTAVATALASRNPSLFDAIAAEAQKHLSPEAFHGAKAAAAIINLRIHTSVHWFVDENRARTRLRSGLNRAGSGG